MAGKKSRRGTKQMGSADDNAGPSKSVGKRVFGGAGARGLAAFDKGGDESSKGAAKSKPAAPQDDDDLLRARLEASPEADDFDLVPTSRSFWEDAAVEKEAGAAAYVPEEERRSSGALKWIVGTVLVGGLGTGAYFIATSGGSGPADEGEEPAAATTTAAAGTDDDEDLEDEDDPDFEDEDEAAAADAVAGSEAEEVAPEGAAAANAMNVSEPAAWAAAVEATNPWVDVAAAPAGWALGLSASMASDARASERTGFRPGAKVMAPETPYRIQAHEVSWGELEEATTIPEVETLARPKWVPASARERAKLPATGVPWSVARAYCVGLGGDLPSEAEWEWAARGPEDNYWPWGKDAFGPDEVHTYADEPVPVVAVTSARLDRTTGEPSIYDLLGNAQEWTRDPWRPSDPAAGSDPKSETHRAFRGWPLRVGDVAGPAEGSTYRTAGCADPSCMAAEAKRLEVVGFRCVSRR